MPSFRLDRLSASEAIVDQQGHPTPAFQRRWQVHCEKIEEAFDSLDARVDDIEALLIQIQAAQDAATTAQTTATESVRETARINSYTAPTNVLTAADALDGTATISIAAHKRVYPVQGTSDVADVSVLAGTITGLAYSTAYWVYYDDATLAATTVTFVATTVINTAQVGAAAGRHFVGTVTTPASGGTATTGTGGSPPSGGGGDLTTEP